MFPIYAKGSFFNSAKLLIKLGIIFSYCIFLLIYYLTLILSNDY
nr:MAG TPA: hypothetical protein [Caudoviricetes sp.]